MKNKVRIILLLILLMPLSAEAFLLRNLDKKTHTVIVTRGGETINVELGPWDVWRSFGSVVNLQLGDQQHTQIQDEQEWIIKNGKLYRQFTRSFNGN